MNLKEIVEQLMACHFTCEAGDLEHNIAFDVLRQWAGMGASVIANPCEEHTDFVGSLCPVCMYAQLESLRGVNQTLADRLAGLEAFADTHRRGPVGMGELTYGDSIFDPSTANKVLVMPPAPDVCKWWEDNDAADSEHAVWMTECGNCNVTTLERGDESRLAGARYCLFCGKQIKVEESE